MGRVTLGQSQGREKRPPRTIDCLRETVPSLLGWRFPSRFVPLPALVQSDGEDKSITSFSYNSHNDLINFPFSPSLLLQLFYSRRSFIIYKMVTFFLSKTVSIKLQAVFNLYFSIATMFCSGGLLIITKIILSYSTVNYLPDIYFPISNNKRNLIIPDSLLTALDERLASKILISLSLLSLFFPLLTLQEDLVQH